MAPVVPRFYLLCRSRSEKLTLIRLSCRKHFSLDSVPVLVLQDLFCDLQTETIKPPTYKNIWDSVFSEETFFDTKIATFLEPVDQRKITGKGVKNV